MFIVFEGIDFSGKSSQIKLLSRYLQERGKSVCCLREPGGDEVSEQIRNILLEPHNVICDEAEALLYSASRAQFVKYKLMPALQEYDYVLLDRYWYSSIAYQGYGRKIDLDFLYRLVVYSTKLAPDPDKTFIFGISYGEMLERKGKKSGDRLEEEKKDFWQRVIAGYEHLSTQSPCNCFISCNSLSINQVFNELLSNLGLVNE